MCNCKYKIEGMKIAMKRYFLSKSKQLWKANFPFLKYISAHHWLIYVLQVLTALFSGFSAALISKSSQLFIDQIVDSENLQAAMMIIIFWMLYTIAMQMIQHFTNLYTNYAYAKASIMVKRSLAQVISNLNMSFYDIPENNNMLARAIKYSESGGPQLLNYLFSLLANAIAIASLLYILTPFSWCVTIFLIMLTIYKMAIEMIITNRKYSFQKENTLLNRRISYFSRILFNANNILDINIFNIFDFFFNKYKKIQDESLALSKKHNTCIGFLSIAESFATVVQQIALYAYIGTELLTGNVSVAEFTMFFTAVNYFNAVLSNLRKALTSYMPMVLESQNYVEFLEPITFKEGIR